MDLAQIFSAGWIFFIAWGLVLAALSAFVFRSDIFGSAGIRESIPRFKGKNL